MYINHNQMAGNVSNTLTSHYSNLATSTQRLSSGLRVNSAADDAAGLAIRELMRADIAALDQGVRNANDAISMIQTADGALGIIDEKLIRMKELAEQASTGTYDSTQRLMIESEYQAMASEITRIANATDFNGIKLLNGNLQGTHDGSKLDAEGSLKVHFGAGNDSAEDYYYVEIEEMTAQALGLGNASTWQDVQNRGADAFKKSLTDQIKNDKTISDSDRAKLLENVDKAVEQYNGAFDNATDYKQAFKMWAAEDGEGFMTEGKDFGGASSLMTDYLSAAAGASSVQGGPTDADEIGNKIKNAIADALPVANEVTWATNDADYAVQKQNIWNDVETAVKTAAKEAGLYDDEIKMLLYGADGKLGLKGEFDTAMGTTAPTGANAAAVQTAGDTLLADAKDKMSTGGGLGTPSSVNEFLDMNHPTQTINGQNSTYGEVIELRNKGYAAYANATGEKIAGPTKADDIVRDLQAAVDEAWSKVDTTKTGALGTANTDARNEYDKVMNALVDKALELGFNATEANALKTVLTTTANIAAFSPNGATAGSITAGSEKDDWAKIKEGLKDALKGLTGNSAATAVNTALNGHANNPLSGKQTFGTAVAIRNQGAADAKANDKLEQFWNGLNDMDKQKLQYAWGQAASYNLQNAAESRDPQKYGIDAGTFSFNSALGLDAQGNDVNKIDNDMLANALKAGNDKISKMDFAGHTIQTQEDAQMALNAINDAITQKDKVRAHLGALQNRLENTVSNLTVQSENLQAAESRISDVDVAKEMTNFVRNQILTQSAVAMLSQANSMPQMAMQLIG